jgi:uncharacterized protein
MSELVSVTFEALELRLADVSQRVVEGIVVPWGEVSFLTPDPKGERFVRGAFTRSVEQRGERIRLFSNHGHQRAVGRAVSWKPNHAAGCWAAFKVRGGADADELLSDVADGLLDAFSVGFRPVRERRSDDGVREVLEAELHEVSLVPIGAYDGARILATRAPAPRFEIPVMPPVNLAPLPVFRIGR